MRRRLSPATGPVPPDGAGLGLRRVHLDALARLPDGRVDFLELAPENWLGVGGRLGRGFAAVAERYPLVLHGLSLDIGGTDPLDRDLVDRVRDFMREHGATIYSEHLTYCAADGHLYDLLPLPFTEAAVKHVVARLDAVQERLGQPLVLENASYYAQPQPDMAEAEFVAEVVTRAGCGLLLDVNNVYVNGINHGYDPLAFIDRLPLDRVSYLHVAGHYDEAEDLKIDTHGTAVIDPVWSLLAAVYDRLGPVPTLLERDVNLPPLEELLPEVDRVRSLQAQAVGAAAVVAS